MAHSIPVLSRVWRFTSHRHSPANKLDCPHPAATSAGGVAAEVAVARDAQDYSG